MKTRDLSNGNPAKVLIFFALPMILSVTLQQIYNIADSSIAGRMISKDALMLVLQIVIVVVCVMIFIIIYQLK